MMISKQMSTVVSTSAITASINFEAPKVIYVDEADIFCGGEKVPETYKEVLGFFFKSALTMLRKTMQVLCR